MINAPPVHVVQRRGDVDEDQHELAAVVENQLIERLAVDVFHQQLDAGDLEPRLLDPQVVDLQQIVVVQSLGDLELVSGLGDVDIIVGVLPLDHLQGKLAIGQGIGDQQDRAARPGAEGTDHPILHLGQFWPRSRLWTSPTPSPGRPGDRPLRGVVDWFACLHSPAAPLSGNGAAKEGHVSVRAWMRREKSGQILPLLTSPCVGLVEIARSSATRVGP